jgi:tartrate dehydratase alpha subunit/fumarate hydratase class I-like protein
VKKQVQLTCLFDLYAVQGCRIKIPLHAKGGGSAIKTYLFQKHKALPESDSWALLGEKMKTIGRLLVLLITLLL